MRNWKWASLTPFRLPCHSTPSDGSVQPLGSTHVGNSLRRMTSPRKEDIPLMQCFEEIYPDTSTLRTLNRCRMAKRVLWLSDISNANGNTVAQWVFTMEHCPTLPYVWPLKHHITKTNWVTWRKYLSCLRQYYPMGPWTMSHNHYISLSLAIYDDTVQSLFIRKDTNTWSKHKMRPTMHSTRSKHFKLVGFGLHVPPAKRV